METEEDPRVNHEEICGAIRFGTTGIEWICVRPAHGHDPLRKFGERGYRDVESHYFINRRPNRKDRGDEQV